MERACSHIQFDIPRTTTVKAASDRTKESLDWHCLAINRVFRSHHQSQDDMRLTISRKPQKSMRYCVKFYRNGGKFPDTRQHASPPATACASGLRGTITSVREGSKQGKDQAWQSLESKPCTSSGVPGTRSSGDILLYSRASARRSRPNELMPRQSSDEALEFEHAQCSEYL